METQPNTATQKPDKVAIWHLLFQWLKMHWLVVKSNLAQATQKTPKQGQTKLVTPEEQFYLDEGIQPENRSGFADKVENGFIAISSGVSLIFFTVILGYGNGFFFSGFHDFSFGGWVFIMYVGGFLLDATATSSLIIAKRNYKTQKVRFIWGVIGFVGLALVSAITQYYMYKAQIARGVIDLPANSLSSVPVFSFLLGNSTVEWFIWARAIVFHAAIVIATFLIPTRTVDVTATVAKMLELTKAKGEIARARQVQEQEKMLTDGFIDMWKTYNTGFKVKMQEWASGQNSTVVTGSVVPQIEYREREVRVEVPVEKVVEKYKPVPEGYVLDSDGNLISISDITPKPQPLPDIPQPIILPTTQNKAHAVPKPIELHPSLQTLQIPPTTANGHSVVEEAEEVVQTLPRIRMEDEDEDYGWDGGGNPLA